MTFVRQILRAWQRPWLRSNGPHAMVWRPQWSKSTQIWWKHCTAPVCWHTCG